MTKRILWLAVSGFMALSLVMAACGPAATPTTPSTPAAPNTPATPTTPTTPTTPAEEKLQKESLPPVVVVPKYGGTITYRLAADPTNFDSGTKRSGGALLSTVYEQYLGNDWTRGPAGSGVTNFAAGTSAIEDSYAPWLAESWQMPKQGLWVLKIRQDIHWQPVNSAAGKLMAGRTVTADDIVSSFNRLITAPQSFIIASQPGVAKSATIEKTGPWEVTIRTPQEYMVSFFWLLTGGGYARLYPPEVVAKYGDMGDWRNAVGTGPFMLVDYVPGSQFVYAKNPVYYGKDPIGPGKGNQLPYADSLRELIIPDLSTSYAALRTGKLDLQLGVEKVDAQSMWKTASKIEYQKYLGASWIIGMRQDKADKPFKDIRVRQALMLATDFESIKRAYYDGDAEIDVWPTNKILEMYVPLDKMPEAVQALYRYNPEKAKQLLKEAGYPNGFKTSIVVQSVAQRIDELSIFKDMWAKVGIELALDIKETGAYSTLAIAGHPYEDMLYRTVALTFAQTVYQSYTRTTSLYNPSHINDPPGSIPYLENIFLEQDKNTFLDMPKVNELVKEVNRFVMEQAYVIARPTPYTYSFWWPWVKNYYGQGTGFVKYSWIDQNLKKSMGY